MLALQVSRLSIAADMQGNDPVLVRDISFSIPSGKVLALVGESGSGKSITAKSLLGMLPESLYVQSGSIRLHNRDCGDYSERQWQTVRGRDIAMISQNPMNGFNPTLSIGKQIDEVLVLQSSGCRRKRLIQREQLLEAVGLAAELGQRYPFEFSGGMLQRALIAMSLAANPKLLIADEPTTALDVITQKQILQLLEQQVKKRNVALLFISHDLRLVSKFADHVAVMYAGEIVEQGPVLKVLDSPQHPYTQDLLAATPRGLNEYPRKSLQAIPGSLPQAQVYLERCVYSPRCRQAMKICHRQSPSSTKGPPHKTASQNTIGAENTTWQGSHIWHCWQGDNDE